MTEQIYRLNDQIAELELDVKAIKDYYDTLLSTDSDEASRVALHLVKWQNELITLEHRLDDAVEAMRD